MAAAMIDRAAREAGRELVVTSSGFLFDDEPADADVAAVMAERGFDLSGHRSRIISPEIVEAADVVLTMQRHHARDVIELCAHRQNRVHTLGGLTSADRLDDESLVDWAERVGESRGVAALLGTGLEGVSDPYGQSLGHIRRTADEIQAYVHQLFS